MKHSLLLSFLMFVCLGVFGQSSSVPPQKVTLNSLQSTIDSQQAIIKSQQSSINTLQDSIQSLQADNADLHKQLDNLEKELDRYHEDIKTKTTTAENHISWWLVLVSIILTIVVTIVVGGLGVLSPLIISRRSEKNAMIAQVQVKHSKQQVSKANDAVNAAKASAAQAQTDADEAKKIVDEAKKAVESANTSAAQAQADAKAAKADAHKVAQVETTVNNLASDITRTATDAQNGFKKAKAIQYFVQALQESDEKRAVELYDKCICEDEEFAEAYNNRGFLRHKIGGPDANKDAMDNYATAITLFDKQGRGIYAEAYNNRGILHFENQELDEAEIDFDTAILKEYAEAYLNRGLLKYMNRDVYEAKEDFDIAIAKKSNFAEAYYIRGLWEYCDYEEYDAINDIIKAKAIKNDVVEVYPNRNFFTGEMKDLDNSFNGVGFSNDMKKLISVPKEKKEPFIILNCVTEIGAYAFNDCTNLTSIKIPGSVTEIGNHAFTGCSSLTSIKIPNSVTKIGHGAFASCISIKEITVDEDNPSYCSKDGGLFSIDMSQLIAVPGGIVSLVIPDGVTKIGSFSFFGCTSLNSIKIPKSVTEIGAYAFHGCSKLTTVEIPDSVTEIGVFAFSRCDNLAEIHLIHKKPNALTGLFYRPSLSKVTLYVPKGSVEAYRKHKYYMRYKEIIEE